MIQHKPSLCCIHTGLQDKGCKFKTMTYSQYVKLGKAKAMEALSERALANMKAIKQHILTCSNHGWNYRIGSNVFPLMTHPQVQYQLEDLKDADKIKKAAASIGYFMIGSDMRCSMHPDQFVVLASEKDHVRESARRELIQHGFIMDLLELPRSYQAPINIHLNCFLGGGHETLQKIADRFIHEYDSLPDSVRLRLVLENEDKKNSWSVKALQNYIFSKRKIPITYDNLHHALNPDGYDAMTALKVCVSTWPKKITPLFHYSDHEKDKVSRAHAISPWRDSWEYRLYKKKLHLEFEFKGKEKAIIIHEKTLTNSLIGYKMAS
jgi:UV DNA damage endonuclease